MTPNHSRALELVGLDASLQQDIAHFGSLANDCRLLKLQAQDIVAQISAKNREIHSFEQRIKNRLRKLGLSMGDAQAAINRISVEDARCGDPKNGKG